MITVTRPFFPPRELLAQYIDQIYQSGWLTNGGPMLGQLETGLADYLGTNSCQVVANGTLALQIAIKALGLEGEVITTPFSYVATTSSLVWEGCTPVFVDIDPKNFNIDPQQIEAAITPRTSAIVATHIFGIPCNVKAIETIANRHGLKVIYDAAHAFGVQYQGRSIFEYGDISVTSFHATKLFHTTEGGGMFTQSELLRKRILQLRNFGHVSPTKFELAGINAKISEVHAAMGLCNLDFADEILEKRKAQFLLYRKLLSDLPLQFPEVPTDCHYNHAYFAILPETEPQLIALIAKLRRNNIFPRRYFYPSLSSLPYVDSANNPTPIADNVSSRIACLPLYHELSDDDIYHICSIIRSELRGSSITAQAAASV